MFCKYLITTCLLFVSLHANAQPGGIAQHYDDTAYDGRFGVNYTQGFNNHSGSDYKKDWLQVAEQAYISKAQAINIAKQRTDGKVLSADLIQREQQAFYKIKVLTDQGRIKTLRINAKRR